MSDLDGLDVDFLAARKITLRRRMRWRQKGHSEYVEAKIDVAVVGRLHFRGTLILVAHRYRQPPKYGFSLLFRGRPLRRLDVNPGMPHSNFKVDFRSLKRVDGTHWQEGPYMDATPDARDLAHRQWLDEFLKKSNIAMTHRYSPPPQGVQLSLCYD